MTDPRPTDLPVRDISRVLLLDPRDRLLLICYEADRDVDPARPGERAFWYTPGGGREEGESFEEAALRELEEETGLTGAPLGPQIALREVPFTLLRKKRFNRERYFLVRSPTADLDTQRVFTTEDNPVLDVRWFTLDEVRASPLHVEPPAIVTLYERILAGDVPSTPVDLG